MATVIGKTKKEFDEKEMAKRSGTPMSNRTIPVHMGNWMKKYYENEDKNYHSENVVRLANLAGHHKHHEEAMDILKRHSESKHGISHQDYKKRNEIYTEHWPTAVSMHEQWLKNNPNEKPEWNPKENDEINRTSLGS